jgi:hypothetical protein
LLQYRLRDGGVRIGSIVLVGNSAGIHDRSRRVIKSGRNEMALVYGYKNVN